MAGVRPMNKSSRSREYGLLLAVVLIVLAFSLVGFWSGGKEPPERQATLSADAAPGVILIDLLESGHPEHYWQYTVQPPMGLVRKVKDETYSDYAHEKIPHVFLTPAGAIGACSADTKAASPDGRYVAYCTSSENGFFVADKRGSGILMVWKPQEWRGIRGFGWAPNSGSVAILNVSSYYGKSPLELLSGLSGHPVPHDTVFLDIIDVRTGKTTEYLVRKNVPYSFTRILNWSE